jgi:serine protease Do
MIRKTLPSTKEATFAILLPGKKGNPTPIGTGFFVSSNGWFVTAAHVITEDNKSNGKVRGDIEKAWLMKEHKKYESGDDWGMKIYQAVSFDFVDPDTDFALLKVDFSANSDKVSLKGENGFPYIVVSERELDDGEPVYSFGYPLSSANVQNLGDSAISKYFLSPRVTSAIVSSGLEKTKTVRSSNDPRMYVLDKALNYGNSGGPIVATETGKVHAFCSGFQPVYVPQDHLCDTDGKKLAVMTPSLYGIVSSLSNTIIKQKLIERDIPIEN